MKILITGGSGLAGKGLESISCNYDYQFVFLSSQDGDLTDYQKTYQLFKKEKPDYVIHLAACVGGLFKNMKEPVEMLEKNLMINYNVLKCCHEFKVKKVVSCLSTCIFPDKTTYPINEKMLHNGPPHTSNEGYAYAKRMLEIHSKAYQKQYNDNFICIIPTNIYGPHDNFSLENGHVIPALIHKCYLAKKQNRPFIIKGSGIPLRQFIYYTDLAKLIMWTLEKYEQKDSIILSVNKEDEISIREIGLSISKCFDYENKIVFDKAYSDGQYKKTADNSKLLKLYGSYQFISVEQGIKETVDWFVKNYQHCRK